MDIRGSLSAFLRNGTGDPEPDDAADDPDGIVSTEGEAGEVEVPAGTKVAVELPEGADAEAVAQGLDDEVAERTVVHGQANEGQGNTVPIADTETTRLGGFFSDIFTEFDRIDDDKVSKLRDNRVEYNELIGKWILYEDDRIPAILNSQVGLILGQDGLTVEPEDPDNEADQRLAEHLKSIYEGDTGDEDQPHIDPRDVVRRIMAQNYMAARSVLRATDLAELPLETLTYYRNPENSKEYYLQDSITYRVLEVDDDADEWETRRKSQDEQLLSLGEHVFDAHLFNTKPLRSVVDLTVNKMVLQRLMARKAEIASVGGLYIKVSPPDWLKESEYHDTIEDPDNEGETIKKLELHMREGISDAFSTLEDYQTGFIMSIPSHWEVNQIEVPETGEPMADQIRAYNKSIAARLMFPIDLMELREGAELSRDTLFRTLLNVIAGWRREILRVFEDFAQVQKDIHNLNGSVNHVLPKLESEDEELVLQALRHAGLAGMTTKEVRQALNRIEGFDLDEDAERAEQELMPDTEPGGPQDADERERSMREMLGDDEISPNGVQPGEQEAAAYTPPEGLDMWEMEGWDQTSVWRAYISLGASHRTCSKRMTGELRNPDAWCAALKDQALGTDLWRTGGGAAPPPGQTVTLYAADPKEYEFSGSLSDFADHVKAVLEENLDREITELESDDDFVAFSPGGVDPSEAEEGESLDNFDPKVVVKAGENEFNVTNASEDDLAGLDERLGEDGAASRPFDVPDEVAERSTAELIASLADDE